MRRTVPVLLALALAGCSGSALEGTLRWQTNPRVGEHALSGRVQNTTSHSLTLDAKAMRLLDDRGNRVGGRVRVARSDLPAHAATTLSATWKSGNPVRIDYGTGTLALPSG
jgi:hypothetical protein